MFNKPVYHLVGRRSVPTALGTILLILTKVPDIIKTAQKIKEAIPAVSKIATDASDEKPIKTTAKEVDPDMG